MVFSQSSIVSPSKITSGSKFRREKAEDTSKVWDFWKYLYENDKFELYHGWSKQMVQILFRETVKGRMIQMYKHCIESCNDHDNNFDTLDLKIVLVDLIKIVLNSGCYQT